MQYNLPKQYYLYLGTKEPRKNLDNLIEAFARVCEGTKKNLKLLIAGKKGWGLFLNYPPFVMELDYLNSEDLPAIYSLSDGLIFPSFKEGFGMPIVEAFAAGTPVLTSNLSSMEEVAGEAAVLVDPYSLEKMTQGIQRFVNLQKKKKTKKRFLVPDMLKARTTN